MNQYEEQFLAIGKAAKIVVNFQQAMRDGFHMQAIDDAQALAEIASNMLGEAITAKESEGRAVADEYYR